MWTRVPWETGGPRAPGAVRVGAARAWTAPTPGRPPHPLQGPCALRSFVLSRVRFRDSSRPFWEEAVNRDSSPSASVVA